MEASETNPQKEKEQPQFDAIIVLGAFMQKDKKSGKYKLPTIIEEDPGKVVGGHSRAIASQQLFKENATPIFLVGGGVQKDESGRGVSRSQTLANLMTEKYKVPREIVVAIGSEGRGNTLGNIQDTIDYITKHPEIIKQRRLGILSNRWQLGRALLMFRGNPYFLQNNIELIPIAVEDVLPRRSEHYKKWARDLESSSEMEHRMKMERKGISAFKSGKYKPVGT